MSETSTDQDQMTVSEADAQESPAEQAGGASDEQLARQLVERSRSQGLNLTGPGGLLNNVTKHALEAALEGEMDEHLGYPKNDPAGRNGANSRNGARNKTVTTDVEPVRVEVSKHGGCGGIARSSRRTDRGIGALPTEQHATPP